ncbi:MAG TPA: hypothetical protein VIK96_03380, partial [Bacilli bacterium]
CYPLEMEHIERRALEEDFTQIKSEFKNLAYERLIRSTDVDLNWHTNNTVYSNLVFDAFSLTELQKFKIKSYEIHFNSESREKDILKIYRSDYEHEIIISGIESLSGKTVFQAKMEF